MFKNVVKEQLKVPAHIDYLADLREFVTRIGRKYGFSDKVINAFKLAIDEAGTNIMRHAYRETGGEGFITIRAIVKENSLTICLIDQGKYFDPKHVKDPDLQRYVEIGKKGGLGIFIMRRLMDEIDYRKTEEGNELRLTKNRDTPVSKRRFGVPVSLPEAVKSMPLSLKTQYWVRTSLVLTALTGIVYFYYFFEAKRSETAQFFDNFIEGSNTIINNLQAADTLIFETSGITASEVIAAQNRYDAVKKAISEIIIVDALGLVLGHTDQAGNYLKEFKVPPKLAEIRPELGIFAYSIPLKDSNGSVTNKEVYDRIVALGKGELHIRALKESLDSQISIRRWAYARAAGLMYIASCIGAFLLIYILMNPFRKLADWVRRADHGEIQDEMDIDASTEIGEIAQAFSEITNKFRESQKNLAEQERLQKEMQVAQEIQQTLLPSEFPELEGYELASYYEAAREVGGDYYDFVEVDKDTLGIAVADVSGKGVPGSLVMTMIRTALRTEARGMKDAAEVLARVNDFVIGDMKKGMFVTIFYVIIDSKRRRLNYASAGHNPMILYRASTKRTYYLNPRGFPIGIQLHEKDLFKKSIESDTIQLAEDDILLIYTDGITEAMNSKRDLFGEERLLKTFREHGQLRVKPFIEQIKEEILSFTEGTPQSDDITLVAIREETSPEKEELRRAKEAHKQIVDGKSIREACENVGITTYAYYNKYKKEFEDKGIDNYEIDVSVSVEAKHIAIEDKVKIFDIIKNHPEYGAKRISEELNTEKYGFTQISESKLYDELVRSRLNTRQLREAFVARGGRRRRHVKQPGTPMLTLDGRVIIDRERVTEPARPKTLVSPPSRLIGTDEKRPRRSRTGEAAEEPPIDISPRPSPAPATTGPVPLFARGTLDSEPQEREDTARVDFDGDALQTPLEELLDKNRHHDTSSISPPDRDESATFKQPRRAPSAALGDAGDADKAPPTQGLEISFEDLFAGGSILDDQESSSTVMPTESAAAKPPATKGQAESAPELPRETHSEEEASFFAVEDILRQEFESPYASSTTETSPDGGDGELPEHPSIRNDVNKVEQPLPPEKMAAPGVDVPYVDIQEILEQTALDGGTHLIEDQGAMDFNETKTDSATGLDEPLRITSSYSRGDSTNGAKSDGAEGGPIQPPGSRARDGFSAPPSQPFAGGVGERESRGRSDSGPRRSRREDDRERLLIAGLRHYKNQRFDDAIAEFERAISIYPNFKEAYSILGNAYFRNRMFDKAASAYARVKEMDPYDTTAYENMGVIYANRGEYVEATNEWERVLEIDPSRDDIRKKIERARLMLTRKTWNADLMDARGQT